MKNNLPAIFIRGQFVGPHWVEPWMQGYKVVPRTDIVNRPLFGLSKPANLNRTVYDYLV